MAITNTTLSAACGLNDTTIAVTATTGFAVGNIIRVDSEFMVQTAAAVGLVVPVRRGGQNGTDQFAHPILASVATGLASDQPYPTPGALNNPPSLTRQIVSYGASGAITPPVVDTIVMLNKATAGVMTLEAPSGLVDGTVVVIYSNTAAAHTVTYTAGFHGDTTSSDVATFAATAGNSMTIMASRGVWGVICTSGVTIA